MTFHGNGLVQPTGRAQGWKVPDAIPGPRTNVGITPRRIRERSDAPPDWPEDREPVKMQTLGRTTGDHVDINQKLHMQGRGIMAYLMLQMEEDP